MSRRAVTRISVLTIAVAGGAVLAALAAAAGQKTGPGITGLTVSGSPARPVFTVTGRGLHVPKPNPRVVSARQPLCPLKTTGNVGFDYGTGFYLIGWDGQPNGNNALLYAAGRYRPSLNELDCIGIVVLSHATTGVRFTFGHAYTQFRSQYRAVQNGDVVEVVLDGAAFATVVHFH